MAKLTPLIQYLKSRLHPEGGNAMIELALALPLLILVLFGGIEYSRYILIAQKVDKAAWTVGNAVSKVETTDSLSDAFIQGMTNAMNIVMYPYGNNTNEKIFITDVSQGPTSSDPLTGNWQCTNTSGTLSAQSQVDSGSNFPNNTVSLASLPGSFNLNPGDEVVVTEIYFQFTPLTNMITALVGLTPLYRTSVFVPRYNSLINAPVFYPPCLGGISGGSR